MIDDRIYCHFDQSNNRPRKIARPDFRETCSNLVFRVHHVGKFVQFRVIPNEYPLWSDKDAPHVSAREESFSVHATPSDEDE